MIDTPEWKSEDYGPLFVTFDIRPANLAVVEPDSISEGWGTYEQIELVLCRQRRPDWLGHELKFKNLHSGGYDWEECDAEVLEKLSASPAGSSDYPSGTWAPMENLVVQSSDYDFGLRQIQENSGADKETANMTYSVYTIFPDAQNSAISLEETARSFTAAICSHLPNPTPSASFEFFGPLPDVGSCISHNHSHTPPSIGYLHSGSEKRRYPRHGVDAVAEAHSEETTYRTFLVVLDKVDWAHDGVLFVWDNLGQGLRWRHDSETLVGRLPGLKTAAERLAGLL